MADKQSREVIGISNTHGGSEWGLLAETADGKYYAVSESEYERLRSKLLEGKALLDNTKVLYETYSDGTPVNNVITSTDGNTSFNTNTGDIGVKVDVDVSDAITGLKAVSREAKEATKALRELEASRTCTVYDLQNQAIKSDLRGRRGDRGARDAVLLIEEQEKVIAELERKISDLSVFSTKTLSEELSKREGVEEFVIGAHGDYAHLHIDKVENGYTETITGPARILVNKD